MNMTTRTTDELRALRLVRVALQEGFKVSLYPEDDLSDPLHKDSTDYDAIKADISCCDMMTITIRKKEGDKTVGASFMLIYDNGEDTPVADYTDNAIGDRFYNISIGLPWTGPTET